MDSKRAKVASLLNSLGSKESATIIKTVLQKKANLKPKENNDLTDTQIGELTVLRDIIVANIALNNSIEPAVVMYEMANSFYKDLNEGNNVGNFVYPSELPYIETDDFEKNKPIIRPVERPEVSEDFKQKTISKLEEISSELIEIDEESRKLQHLLTKIKGNNA